MPDRIEAKKRLLAIHKISSPIPHATAIERLKKIEGIANGSLDPLAARTTTSPDLRERLEAGMASRTNRKVTRPVSIVEPEKDETGSEDDEKKKREEKAGHNRLRRGGRDRSEDSKG